MDFSKIPYDSILGEILRLPLRFLPKGLILPILQGKLKGEKWIVGSSTHGCWLGSYEHDKRILFEKTITKGSIVFDIGANVGFYTLLASKLVGTDGKVFSFEPFKENIFYLKKHLLLNKVQNVTIIEAAVTDFNGYTYFSKGDDRCTGHISISGETKVKAISIDDLIDKKQVDIPNFIKIDVEGSEGSVLNGLKKTIGLFRLVIFLATHSTKLHSQCCNILKEYGYQVQPIGSKGIEDSDELIAKAHQRD